MTELTGRPSTFRWIERTDDPAQAYGRLKVALEAGQIVNIGTPSGEPLPRGLEKGHADAVLGYEEVEGVRQLVVRSPWGSTEPGNDGLFCVPADQVAQFFVGAWAA